MTRFGRAFMCVAGLIAVGSPVASAAPFAPITGKLDHPGYTVIALALSGESRPVLATAGTFRVVPPAATVTLQLRAPDGAYAGPIVLVEKEARVKTAQAVVTKAQRKATLAKRAEATARRQYKKARSRQGRRNTARRLKQARSRLRTANAQLKTAKRKLAVARKLAAVRASRPITGVKAGAALGAVRVDSAVGYAVARGLGGRAWTTAADVRRVAQGTKGVPIGAGNFGLVRSRRTDGAPSRDTDLDGVPDSLDVDDDGDLILDDTERSAGARASQVGGTLPGGSRLSVHTNLGANEHGVNVNSGSTDEQIAAIEAAWGSLNIFWTGADPGSAELDCRGLAFCSLNGTGVLPKQGSIFRADGTRFPECCDADADGFGTLVRSPSMPVTGADSGGMTMFHGASIDQIGTGDLLILRATANGVATESATTVGFAFSTTPVFASYDDGQGKAGAISYPRGPCVETGAGAPCPLPVGAGPSGDLVLTLSVWRPQRRRLGTEPGEGRWMDMGNLAYMVSPFMPTKGAGGGGPCRPASLSENDANLEPTPSSPYPGPFPDAGGFRDLLADQPPNPANKFTFTVNLTQCLAANNATFGVGDEVLLNIHAFATGSTGTLATAQSFVNFKRER